MAKPVWTASDGSITIAVESGKDDANHERVHVHVYKNGRRTNTRIQDGYAIGSDLDASDVKAAENLYDRNYSDIRGEYEKVKQGYYGD